MLRTLAKSDGCYIISLFDCCREKVPTNNERRGLGDYEENDFDVIGTENQQ